MLCVLCCAVLGLPFTDPARKEGILPAAVLYDARTLKRQQRNAYLYCIRLSSITLLWPVA